MKELRRRFVGLDKKVQIQVIMHHLGRERACREWAYSKLLDLWDDSFAPIISDLWNHYHEEQCAWPIIRHFPISFVQEHQDELSKGRNKPFVVRRLCDEESYLPDKEELDPYEYIWALSTSGRTISDDDAWDLLVSATREVCDAKSTRDFEIGMTFSAKINRILYHLEKMGLSHVTDKYLKWYEETLGGTAHDQLGYWYRLSKHLAPDEENHPYIFLVEKISPHLTVSE